MLNKPPNTYHSLFTACFVVLVSIAVFVLITPQALSVTRLIESISPKEAAVGSLITLTGSKLSNSVFIIDTEGDTQNVVGTVNSNRTSVTFTVPGGLRKGVHQIKSGPTLTDISNGVTLTITAGGAPVIERVVPSRTVPGDTVTVYGFNLTEDVNLKAVEGNFVYSVSEASVSKSTKELKIKIPLGTLTGQYSVIVASTDGITESPQTITINNGGEAFGDAVSINIPTEGLPTLGQLVSVIFTWSINLLGIVVFVMIFFAGFKWATAAGNTARVSEAKSQISNAILGAIILLAAWIILYTINPDLVGGEGKEVTLPGVGTEN